MYRVTTFKYKVLLLQLLLTSLVWLWYDHNLLISMQWQDLDKIIGINQALQMTQKRIISVFLEILIKE